MELLLIKSGKDYIRIKENRYIASSLEKASVFPFDQIESVKQHMKHLEKLNFENVSVKKLILKEEDYAL